MIRLLISLLLIAGTLACPFRCIINCSAIQCVMADGWDGDLDRSASIETMVLESDGTQLDTKKCDCCSQQNVSFPLLNDEAKHQQSEPEPIRDCSCRNCFCDGAILEQVFQWSTVTDSDWPAFINFAVQGSAKKFPHAERADRYSSIAIANFLYLPSRSLCITQQSWQL